MANGTYQESKHGGRRREPAFCGTPKKPKRMPKEAGEFWDQIVPSLENKGVAKAIDAAALELMCIWWARLKKLQRMKKDNYQTDCRLAMASKQWQSLAAKFGLTPADRARLEVQSGADETNPLEQMVAYQPSLKVTG